jgi:hypothetical protein
LESLLRLVGVRAPVLETIARHVMGTGCDRRVDAARHAALSVQLRVLL